jgi:hypothetical protein
MSPSVELAPGCTHLSFVLLRAPFFPAPSQAQGNRFALSTFGSASSFTRVASEAVIVCLDMSGSMGSPAFVAGGGAMTRSAAVATLFHAFANRTVRAHSTQDQSLW